MKRVYILFLISALLLSTSYYLAHVLKERAVKRLSEDRTKVTIYKQWGFDTTEFERLYQDLLSDAKQTSTIAFPFAQSRLQTKQSNILRLTQAGYATEISLQKDSVQRKLSYLRERIKSSSALSDKQKQEYSDVFEIVAGETFERNSDILKVKQSIALLDEKDASITKQLEAIKRESLIAEIQSYKTTCSELYSFFETKNSQQNLTLAASCINQADAAFESNTIDATKRENIFSILQEAISARQNIVQEELYLAEQQRKEAERLTLVPASPRQEGKVIVINLDLQRLYAYDNGVSIYPAAVPVTTGKYGFETVRGEFAIYLKKQNHKMVSPFPGIYYDDVVQYWMPFYLGYGLHDASWRSVYGTQDYPVVGSHGCVNTPLNDVIVLYNWAEVGTKVLVL